MTGNVKKHSWTDTSFIHRCIGSLSHWRSTSWLLSWSEVIGVALLALLFSLAPFVSNSLLGVILIAIAGFWLLLTISDTVSIRSGIIDRLVLLYWGIATVATAFSPVKSLAFGGWVKLTLYLFLFALSARLCRQEKALHWLSTIFLHVALVVSIYGIRQEFFGATPLATWNDPDSPLAQDTRVYSYLGNPNLLAGYLLGAIALSLAAVFVWRSWWQKSLAVTMLLVNSACLIFTDSRGGWLAMAGLLAVFSLLTYFWYYHRMPRWCRIWLPLVVGGAIAGFIVVAFVQVESIRLRLLSIFAGREDSSNNFRLNVWASVVEMIQDYPILGIGPGNDAFNAIYPVYMRPNYTALGSYSIYLETAVEMGILGLSCFLGLIGVTISRGIYHWRKLSQRRESRGFWVIGAIAGITGILIQGGVDTVWYRPQINTIWWFLLAIIASLDFSVVPSIGVEAKLNQ